MDVLDLVTDEKKETEGTWIPVQDMDFEMLIAADGNPRHLEAVQQAFTKRPILRNGAPPSDATKKTIDHFEAERHAAAVEAMGKTILLGWRTKSGDQVMQGDKRFDYSEENALWLVSQRHWFNLVQRASQNLAFFKAEGDAAEEKS